MKRQRHIPETPYALRETRAREIPDEITVRPFAALGAVRYAVEARCKGRSLGDRAFPLYADALAFAKLEAGYNGARIVDLVKHG